MDALLIGSRAQKHWFSDARLPRDWDIFITAEQRYIWLEKYQGLLEETRESRTNKYAYILKCGTKIEMEVADCDSASGFIEANQNMPLISVFGVDAHIARPGSLMAIKKSHLYWPHNWLKHIRDYHFLKNKDIIPSDLEREIGNLRFNEKKDGNPDKTIFSLNVTNEEFFDASEGVLKRSFEHDDIHAATCYYDEPLYRKAKMVDKDLFKALSYEDQCRMVREEVFVIALERRIIPHLLTEILPGEPLIDLTEVRRGFDYAIMRICTSMTRGWFREFAIENFPAIYDYNVDFVKKFLLALKAGKVREREISSGGD
jgi:hypothetical protein